MKYLFAIWRDILSIGIYRYVNNKNGKSYVGQSINLEQRKNAHKSSSFNPNASDYNSQFHMAVRKYGLESFDYEILENVKEEDFSQETLNNLEIFYIKKFNSFENGYNASLEGSLQVDRRGASNGRSLLSENDIFLIREKYNNHVPFREVFKEFKRKISKRGLQKIWSFETWKHICPEYNTSENKYWHSHAAKANDSKTASKNKRKFSSEEVKEMRKMYDAGVKIADIYKIFGSDLNLAKSTVYNVVKRITYKDIL